MGSQIPWLRMQLTIKRGNKQGDMSSKNGRTLKIGLLDHMGYGNLGDAATQDVAIANIRKRLPDAQLIGFSLVPSDTTMRHGIPCYPIGWWHPESAKKGVSSADSNKTKSGLKAILKGIPLVSRLVKPLL